MEKEIPSSPQPARRAILSHLVLPAAGHYNVLGSLASKSSAPLIIWSRCRDPSFLLFDFCFLIFFQALNRYAYVKNNPLRFTDPDGHGFWDKVKQWIGTIITVALCVLVPGATLFLKAVFSVIGNAVSTVVNGGNWKSFTIGIGISIAAAGIASGVGGHFGGGVEAFSKWASESIIGAFVAGALTGAIAGGISSAVYGTNVGQGMLEGLQGGVIGTAVGMATTTVLEAGKKFIAGMIATAEATPDEVITACVFSENELESLQKSSDIDFEQSTIEFESYLWAYRNPSASGMAIPDGNAGWKGWLRQFTLGLFGNGYHCVEQNTDLAKYINDVIKPKYFTAQIIAGEGGNRFTNGGYTRHAAVYMRPTVEALKYGAKPFIVDAFAGMFSGPNFRTWNPDNFMRSFPLNQYDGGKPFNRNDPFTPSPAMLEGK